MGVKLMYVFVLSTRNCLSSLDVSEVFASGVSSMYICIMHYLNFFRSCSIKNLILASLSSLFTIKSDDNFPFYKFLFPQWSLVNQSNYRKLVARFCN